MDTLRKTTPSKTEAIKLASDQLRGPIAAELAEDSASVSADTDAIIKHHGIYQQDNRDLRHAGSREYDFLVRTRLPGGMLTAVQLLAELALADELGNGTLRITDRQGFQLHGILKQDLREVIRRIDRTKLTTFGACGDVVRNVMCCPAPVKDSLDRALIQEHTAALARHFALRSRAYYEIWLDDGEQCTQVGGAPEESSVEEPLYGAVYLPRKFKFAFALPEDNCVDVLTHDVGVVLLPGDTREPRFNVYVGGGMGVTPSRADTFPALAQPFASVSSDHLIPLAQALVEVQRDFGNRNERKRARFKYLVADWGIDRLRAETESLYGEPIPAPEPIKIAGLDDHLGWHPQTADLWFLGLCVESGRIKDTERVRLKSALRAIADEFSISARLTPLQDILLCDIEERARPQIEAILHEHGVSFSNEILPLRQRAIACPALPTCGLAITESERAIPSLLTQLEALMHELGLRNERISVRMTGCPNGCSRPYVAEIGIVGKAADRYTLFLGGSAIGTRLAFEFRNMLTLPEVIDTLRPILTHFAATRASKETFGDYCFRLGAERLAEDPSRKADILICHEEPETHAAANVETRINVSPP